MIRRALILTIAVQATSARADPDPAYDLRLDVDLPALAIAATATTAWFLDLGPAWCAPQCDQTRLNPIDRPFAGRYSEGWSKAGTAVAALVMATPPVVLYAFESSPHVANDSVVIAEAMLFSSGFDAVLQTAVRRPRPFLYGTAAPLVEREATNASLSFPSGHTALSFAATIATWRTLDLLHAPARWRWAYLAVGLAGSTFVAGSRVAAGDHFPTDVTAAAAIGASFGLLLPALHRRHVRVVPTAAGPTAAAITAVGAF